MLDKGKTYQYISGTLRLYAFIYGRGTRQVAKRDGILIEEVEKAYNEMIAEHQAKTRLDVWTYRCKYEM